MQVATIVHVNVIPEHIDAFIKITKENHENSIREPGNLRFDILQDAQDKGKFVFYEVYASEEHAAAHKLTTHYAKWRDTVAPWMAKPREGIKHELLLPAAR